MSSRFVWKVRDIVKYLLIAVSVLLGAALVAFLTLSAYGTNQRDRLTSRADAFFGSGWTAQAEIPWDLPVQQIVVVNASGEIELSMPERPMGALSGLELPSQAAELVGSTLDPLVDRYPYIGRVPTFLIRSYPQQDGSLIAAALWLPSATRLIWTSYAAMIYLYLVHWLLSAAWVYCDTKAREVYPWHWTLFTSLANIVGLLCYLSVRRSQMRNV